MRHLIIILLTLLLPVGGIEAQTKNRAKSKRPTTSAEAKKMQNEARKDITLTENQIKENDQKVGRGLAELGKIDISIEQTRTSIERLNRKISLLNKEIGELGTEINANQTKLQTLRDEYLKAVKKMRVSKKNKSDLAFIFSSKNFNQAQRRMRYLKEFSSWRSRQTDAIKSTIDTLQMQRIRLEEAEKEQASALALQKENKVKLDRDHKVQEELVAELKKNGAALQTHLKRKQAEAKELGNMVSQLIAEENRKAEEARKAAEAKRAEEARKVAEAKRAEEARKAEESRKGELAMQEKGKEPGKNSSKDKKSEKSKGGEYANARKRAPRSGKESNVPSEKSISSDNEFSALKGKLPVPTNGSFNITSRFGRQNLPDLPDVEYDNPGVDAESDKGASARAVFNGTVSGVYLLPGYNTVVIINHGNYYTVYGNIKSPAVKNGDTVEAGHILGSLADSEDNESLTSIHFEVWRNREKLNPQEWLQ